jgi:thymidylate synthase
LTHIFAKRCGLKAKELTISFGDVHVYSNHIDQVQEQLTRTPMSFSKLKINEKIETTDYSEWVIDDFELLDYKCHSRITAKMAV